jgi:hypothetical protein
MTTGGGGGGPPVEQAEITASEHPMKAAEKKRLADMIEALRRKGRMR